MLYMVRVRLAKPATMSNQEFYSLWLEEAAAATGAVEAGIMKGLWKVAGLNEVIGVLDVESPDMLDGALHGLPLWSKGYAHLITDLQVTPLRSYAAWYEDLKKMAASKDAAS